MSTNSCTCSSLSCRHCQPCYPGVCGSFLLCLSWNILQLRLAPPIGRASGCYAVSPSSEHGDTMGPGMRCCWGCGFRIRNLYGQVLALVTASATRTNQPLVTPTAAHHASSMLSLLLLPPPARRCYFEYSAFCTHSSLQLAAAMHASVVQRCYCSPPAGTFACCACLGKERYSWLRHYSPKHKVSCSSNWPVLLCEHQSAMPEGPGRFTQLRGAGTMGHRVWRHGTVGVVVGSFPTGLAFAQEGFVVKCGLQ